MKCSACEIEVEPDKDGLCPICDRQLVLVLSPQAANVKKTTEDFVDGLMKDMELPEEMRRPLHIAYISGLLNVASVMSMNDGIHPSKLAVGIREAGTEWLGLRVGRIGE